ncbi:DUF488 domain-containing protein [Chitinophaga agrisoli]|uniref:DUF488 domain-containing protein n=1 Tax=Chitinophaga agrisoli TaxID=2607653 RepID=A0A5B2W3Z0_9BACT|nr:DUF488 domain-containing protein [Chitinophaga agrisoli]KAA2245402.1 DUF488 domain-containing protein [Chitinophaga agrisoli]
MEKRPLYTIGHGRRTITELIELLHTYQIRYLIDVRSIPYSRFNPQFNRNQLQTALALQGIRYVFMGDSLGGRPSDPDCYQTDGCVNYEVISAKDSFKDSIRRLQKAYAQNVPLAIMCSESDPARCHRSKLIGAVLVQEQVIVHHIDEKGLIKEQMMGIV